MSRLNSVPILLYEVARDCGVLVAVALSRAGSMRGWTIATFWQAVGGSILALRLFTRWSAVELDNTLRKARAIGAAI